MRIEARAPTRLDFGGGWTDVPPYPEQEEGFVCNLAIARHAYVSLATAAGETQIDERGSSWRGTDLSSSGAAPLARAALRRAGVGAVRLTMRSDFPSGAGLGGSSAAGVALAAALAALRGESPERVELAERSRAVEVEELRVAGGRQDHYSAALGGALALTFQERVTVRRIPVADAVRREIERRFVVAYTGESRLSGDTITAVIDAFRARTPAVTVALARMKVLARLMADALARGDLDGLGALIGEHWVHQRSLHSTITTAGIERVMQVGYGAGAIGAKALGASGGGCVLLIAPADDPDRLRQAVGRVAELLPFEVDQTGVQVTHRE